MAKSFNDKLIELLKTDPRFVDDEGELVKAAVIDRAWKIDRELVKLLLSLPEIKEKFFDEIEGHWIFNINTFIEYISDKNFLANSYTRFRNKIGLTIDGKFLRERGEVSLVWPYKDCVLEGGQTKEEEKRKEIFFNEILAQDEIDRMFDPKVLTNWKRYTVDGEQKVTEIERNENSTIRENLIIKGNNLMALHSLKKQFRGKVKLIYIDPPFNTGNDEFNYNDRFNHSSWLTFMKNRLEVAANFLRKDGVIFIHHDDKEFSYLKALCDEVFGRDNFLNNIVVKTSDPSGHKTVNPSPYSQTEYILMYAKSRQNYKYDTHYVPSEYDPGYNQYIENISSEFSEWVISPLREKVAHANGYDSVRVAISKMGKHAFNEIVADFALKHRDSVFQATAISNDAGSEIVRLRDNSKENRGVIYCYKREGYDDVFIRNGRQMYFYASKVKEIDGELTPVKPLTNLWTDIPYNGISREGGVRLKNGKKPEKLLRRMFDLRPYQEEAFARFFHCLDNDFPGKEWPLHFLFNMATGSGKTLIMAGLILYLYEKGYRNFLFFVNSTNIIEKTKDNFLNPLSSKFLFAENSFLNWYVNPEMPEEAVNDFIEIGKGENGLEKQKKLLADLLNKNQLYVNLSEIDDEDFGVSEEDKKLNRLFYGEAYNG